MTTSTPIDTSTIVTTVTDDMKWGLNRICNRFRPLVTNPTMATLTSTHRVEVILMDSGVNKTHQEFATATIEDLYFVPGFGSITDDLGHGTALASLIVGSTLGVNPKAVIKVVKVLGANYETNGADILKAFDAVYAYHQTCLTVPKIVNIAWDVPFDADVNAKLHQLMDAGVTIIAAAGNSALDIDTISPAGFAGVVAVAGSTKDDNEYNGVYGTNKKLDIYAPASPMAVACYTQIDGYVVTGGSSLSAAFVSGVASIISGLLTTSTPTGIVDGLKTDATPSALLVNANVSYSENRLLHRPDSAEIPLDQDYYAGNLTVGSGIGLELSLQSIMSVQAYQDNFAGLTFSVQWGDAETSSLFDSVTTVSTAGDIVIAPIADMSFDEAEVVRQFHLNIKATNESITMVSPTIYFFVSSVNATGLDVSASIEELRSHSTLVPLTLLHGILK